MKCLRMFLKVLISFLLFNISFAFAQSLSIRVDNPEAIRTLNSKVFFIVDVPGKGTLEYILSFDGARVIKKEKRLCEKGRFEIVGILDRPGFLLCQLSYMSSGTDKKQNAVAAVAYEPEKIKPAFEGISAGFNEFWAERKKQLSFLPMNPVFESIDSGDENIRLCDIKVNCIGMPVSGYYARPAKAKKKSCPAILFMQGAGVYSAAKSNVIDYVQEGFIALEINAHGIENGHPTKYYKNLSQTTYKDYKYWGKESPYTSYFVGMFLRVIRALDFLKSQPEWDGEILIAYGSSQGGAQAIAAAGLDDDVTFMFAAVPAMCDCAGKVNGWPKFVPLNTDGSYHQQMLESSRYVDCVNFARRAKAKAFFTVGFVDNCCRPTSVYAGYNSYACEKEILHAPTMSHAFPQEHQKIAKEKILAYLRQSK